MFSFLLRAAFWITVLAFLLPSAGNLTASHTPQQETGFTNAALASGEPAAQAEPDMDAGEALTLAAKSANDVLGFCDRNPDVCDRSSAVVNHVINQTTYYGGQIFAWLSDKARETTAEEKSRAAAQPENSDTDTQHQAPAYAVPAARPPQLMTGA